MAEYLEGEPPDLSFTLTGISDIEGTPKEWTYVANVVLPIDVLLLTVKECEFLSCYSYLQNPFQSYRRGLGYVFFGYMGKTEIVKVKVALIRCYEGATDPRGSLITVKNAVMELKPKAVFCVGFAGALNYEKVKLGDVVVSSKLTTYAHKKTTNDRIQPRGFTAPVSRNISDLIIYSAVGWKAPLKNPEVRNVKVHCDGEFLSGPELVNSGWRREELVTLYPNAIAIEMEGEGVFAAAFDLEMEWVVIKGISDYADGTKGATASWRPFASTMAASVVANILKNPMVFQNWHNYNHGNDTACTRTSSEGLFPSAIVSTPRPGNLGDLLGSLFQTPSPTSGQFQYKGRTINYSAKGRIHSLEEPWVFDGTAWDVESGISEQAHHYKDDKDAIKQAFNKLVAKLEQRGILQN